MNILSLKETDDAASEADQLCRLIETHQNQLRQGNLGDRFHLNKAAFRLIQRDRNVVYRIDSKSRWFLKLPARRSKDMIEREILGAQIVRAALVGTTGYHHPHSIRASEESHYILYAEIPGRQLNHAFYLWSLTSFCGGKNRIRTSFEILGKVLSRFHYYQSPPQNSKDGTIQSNRDTLAGLRQVAKLAKNSKTQLTRDIVRWSEEYTNLPKGSLMVHGNFKPENVLETKGI